MGEPARIDQRVGRDIVNQQDPQPRTCYRLCGRVVAAQWHAHPLFRVTKGQLWTTSARFPPPSRALILAALAFASSEFTLALRFGAWATPTLTVASVWCSTAARMYSASCSAIQLSEVCVSTHS